jgi:spore germination protein GerM
VRRRTCAMLVAFLFSTAAVACTDGEPAQTSVTTATTTRPESQTDAGVLLNAKRHVCTDVPEPAAEDGTKPVKVFFVCPDWLYGHYLVGVSRLVAVDADPLEAAMRELLRGPSEAERAAGLYANFTAEHTGEALLEARVDAGRGIVNLDPKIIGTPALNNVTTSAGGFGFFWPLYATVFQFPEIDEVVPQWNGDAKAWGEWDQTLQEAQSRTTYPMAPVPVDADGPIAAATYVAQVLQRFAQAPWFETIRFVQPEGSGVGVRIDGTSAATAKEVAGSVARILADSGRFCDVYDVDIRNGSDDRSNLASARKKRTPKGLAVPCWADGYEIPG